MKCPYIILRISDISFVHFVNIYIFKQISLNIPEGKNTRKFISIKNKINKCSYFNSIINDSIQLLIYFAFFNNLLYYFFP